jgi:hypothetical protein
MINRFQTLLRFGFNFNVLRPYVKGFDLVIGSLVAFAFIGLQLYYRPYENAKLQFLQTVSLTDQYLAGPARLYPAPPPFSSSTRDTRFCH